MRQRAFLRSPRSIAGTAVEAAVFVAAAILILFGLGVFNRALSPPVGGAAAIDGDSLRQGDVEIRLHGIDAPEYLQPCLSGDRQEWPCGRHAAAFLANLVRGKTVSCVSVDTDRYGRLVAVCEAGGRSLNQEMVRQGWAVAYRRHSQTYADAEANARRARLGIWNGTFEEPEKWRERMRHSEQVENADE
jgi:endonuclease YncB( thermonuclease family)